MIWIDGLTWQFLFLERRDASVKDVEWVLQTPYLLKYYTLQLSFFQADTIPNILVPVPGKYSLSFGSGETLLPFLK